MTPIDKLLPRLEGVKETGPGRWISRCPGHADRSPSLAIREMDDSRLLLRCFAGCDTGDLVAAVGLTLADLYPQRAPAPGGGTPPVRQPFNAMQLIRLAAHESGVLAVILSDAFSGTAEPDLDRALTAASRLADIAEAVHG